MKGTYAALMQSRFFNPAFNSAIFDGPVRIYFAQIHESLALKIYFLLQQNHGEAMAKAKELHRGVDRTILVMLYPTNESFAMSFEGAPTELTMAVDDLDGDTIIGLNGPINDEQIAQVIEQVLACIKKWEALSVATLSQRPVEASL